MIAGVGDSEETGFELSMRVALWRGDSFSFFDVEVIRFQLFIRKTWPLGLGSEEERFCTHAGVRVCVDIRASTRGLGKSAPSNIHGRVQFVCVIVIDQY